MATKMTSISGSYDKTVEDSSHQASNKFTKHANKPTDSLKKPSTGAQKSRYGGDTHSNP